MDRIADNILASAQESANGYVYDKVEGRYIDKDDTVQYVLGAGQSITLPLDYDPDEVDEDDMPVVTLGEGTIVDIVDMDRNGSWYRIYGAQTADGVEYGLSAT